MWEWREDTVSGRWRLSETGSWLWDEPSDLDRYVEAGYDGLTRSWPETSWRPAWSGSVRAPETSIGSRPYLDDHRAVARAEDPVDGDAADTGRGFWPDLVISDAEPTPIFEAVAEDRNGGGGAHAADADRSLHPDHPDHPDYPVIPAPSPGSGPLPVQRLDALRDAESPEDELRRRAERRRRPLTSVAAEPGRHADGRSDGRHGRS